MNGSVNNTDSNDVAPVVEAAAVQAQARRVSERSVGSEYGDTLGCRQCYAKHLSKAAVEAVEFFEEPGREAEFALCVGDLACAEDHARALGFVHEADRIRGFRDRLWDRDRSVHADILRMAADAARGVFQSRAR